MSMSIRSAKIRAANAVKANPAWVGAKFTVTKSGKHVVVSFSQLDPHFGVRRWTWTTMFTGMPRVKRG